MNNTIENDIAEFENRVQAINNLLENNIVGLGPTSRNEAKMIAGMLEDVKALGTVAIKRRRLK